MKIVRKNTTEAANAVSLTNDAELFFVMEPNATYRVGVSVIAGTDALSLAFACPADTVGNGTATQGGAQVSVKAATGTVAPASGTIDATVAAPCSASLILRSVTGGLFRVKTFDVNTGGATCVAGSTIAYDAALA